VTASKPQSDWARLFRMACSLIRQVNSKQTLIDHWTFGGGTALMLHIDHRESRDVDIFLDDPQLLAFLDLKSAISNSRPGRPTTRATGPAF
jgi:hypothetical protein